VGDKQLFIQTYNEYLFNICYAKSTILVSSETEMDKTTISFEASYGTKVCLLKEKLKMEGNNILELSILKGFMFISFQIMFC
jgi:hypothetical protein